MDLARLLAVYDERVDGLLGLDFLQEFSSVLIDTETKKITFRKSRISGASKWEWPVSTNLSRKLPVSVR